MEKDLAQADDRLAKFFADSKGTISSPTEYTWKRGGKRAKLDHGISWNFHLASPRAVFNDIAHQRFDHATLSFGLPPEEVSKKPGCSLLLKTHTGVAGGSPRQDAPSLRGDRRRYTHGDTAGRSRGDEG